MIIGHRGASAVAPENTLAAFERALDDGAHGIELDVRLARDGVVVVIHDPTLRRTSLTSGEVGKMTTKELAAVDVGSWFNHAHPLLARQAYEQQRVPTLSEVFQLMLDKPGVIYVELKTDGAASKSDLIQPVADLIVTSNFQERVTVVSFDLATLTEIKSRNSSIRTGALFEPRSHPRVSWRADRIMKATVDCGAGEIVLHRLLARRRLIEKALDRNLPLVVWTVDDPQWVPRARSLGVHALIANDPAKMLAVT